MLTGEGLEKSANLPYSDVLAQEIVEDLEITLEGQACSRTTNPRSNFSGP
jgi:hypothetical protein